MCDMGGGEGSKITYFMNGPYSLSPEKMKYDTRQKYSLNFHLKATGYSQTTLNNHNNTISHLSMHKIS